MHSRSRPWRYAEEVCPFGEVDCTYPGDCSRYVDINNDGICDLSQTGESVDPSRGHGHSQRRAGGTDHRRDDRVRRQRKRTRVARSSVRIVHHAHHTRVCGPATEAAVDTDSGGNPLLTHYYVSPIAIGFFLIYAISFVLYKTKRIKIATHRKIWNVLLLATFLVTGIFGLILTIQLDYRLPFQMPVNLLFWHVEAGIVMTLISIFHIAWHAKYYAKLLRTSRSKRRAAESAERYPAQRGVARGQLPHIPERVHAFDRRWES